MKKAVIDMGSNSTRLAKGVIIDGALSHYSETLETTRLMEGMNERQELGGLPLARTMDIVHRFYNEAIAWGADQVICSATAAFRMAKNGQKLIEDINKWPNVRAFILSEEDEARYNYLGATLQLDHAKNPLVLDIGGGSTEVCMTLKDGSFRWVSLPLGAVRLDGSKDPQAVLKSTLNAFDFSLFETSDFVVGTGGTITTLSAILLEAESYDPDYISGRIWPMAAFLDVWQRLQSLNVEQRANVKGLPKARCRSIMFGMMILFETMAALGKDTLMISCDDILKGLLYADFQHA